MKNGNGIEYVRVTEVLSRVGMRKPCPDCHGEGCSTCKGTGFSYWESISHAEFADNPVAADFGTQLHKAGALHLQRKNFKCDDLLYPYLAGLDKFMKDYKVKYDSADVEKRYWHDVFKYTGQIDLPCIITINKKQSPAVIDWKSSTSNFTHWKYQLAAYTELYRWNEGIKERVYRGTVRLLPENYDLVFYNNAGDFNKFLSFLNTLRS